MYKYTYILALLLANSSANMRAPESVNLFATGSNGDADLGQEIGIKGKPYSYVQTKLGDDEEPKEAPNTGKAVGCPPGATLSEHGNCHFEAELVKTKRQALAEPLPADSKKTETVPVWNSNPAPEKVSVLDTPIASKHTTFYPQEKSFVQMTGEDGEKKDKKEEGGYSANMGPEKVQELIPESYNTFSNADDKSVLAYPYQRTAFYVQLSDDEKK
jgi:hypothetical protein